MRILLLGEFSNVHWTLACALRKLGHEVMVVSDGNSWREYPCDVLLYRRSSSLVHTIKYVIDILCQLPKWRGYDVVQIISPVLFLKLKPRRLKKIYDYLLRHNKRVYMGAMSDDYQYIYDSYVRRRLRYCDFYTPQREIDNERNRQTAYGWLYTYSKDMCVHVTETCNGVAAVLYEYYVAYKDDFPQKTFYIPFPIEPDSTLIENLSFSTPCLVRFFVGMDNRRDELKGTDILYKVAKRIENKYPDKCEVIATESLPYSEYIKQMKQCDVLLDQIYSYTPAMNALQAMSMGLVVVGGGEEEHYELMGEKELRPIINVQPEEEDVYRQLEQLVLHPERIPQLKRDGIEYVRRHHDSIKVAQQYLEFWNRKI
ncbi:MAG: glycosyltransferase family 1 protein [Bacteroidaceae bacterium]|nr:glycosyltransferase family 1 protein [Bacteroidaceae bacterium]